MSAAAPIPILGGTRLTGRVGKGVEIGLLNIQQREFETINATNFTVGRLRKNILANSDIGVMITNKEVQGSSHYNRAYGADGNFRFGRYTNVNTYIAKTATPGITSKDLAGRFAASYINDAWNFRGSYTAVQENFNDEMGYVPRKGIRKSAGYAGYTWRPARWRRTIRSINPHSQIDYVLDPDRPARHEVRRLPSADQFSEQHVHRNRQESVVRISVEELPDLAVERTFRFPPALTGTASTSCWSARTRARKIVRQRPMGGRTVLYGLQAFVSGWSDVPAQQQADGGVQLHAQQHQPARRPLQDESAEHAHQLWIQHDDVHQFADSVQQRHASVEFERALQHHSPAAQRHFYRL